MKEQFKTIDTEVLYQKLGNTWYAFAEINGEVLFRALPEGTNPNTTKFEFTQIVESVEKVQKNFELVA